MSNPLSVVICLHFLCLVIILPGQMAYAGDEDLSSSVYLVFDPETGEFVTVQDQNRAKQQHDANDPAAAAGAAATSHGKPDGTAPLPLAAGVVVLALLTGAIAWTLKKKRAQSGEGAEASSIVSKFQS